MFDLKIYECKGCEFFLYWSDILPGAGLGKPPNKTSGREKGALLAREAQRREFLQFVRTLHHAQKKSTAEENA